MKKLLRVNQNAFVTSVNGAAEFLDCGRDKIYDLIEKREIESYLDGRARRITIDSLKKLVARRVATAQPTERLPPPPRRSRSEKADARDGT